MKHRGIIRLALLSTLASFTGLPPATIKAQQVLRSPENAVVRPTPPAASAATAVPALVPYSGYGTNADGKPITGEVPVTFLLYKDETGGEAVFTESQVAAFDPAGHYELQLGATLSNGIPIDLFGSGEARWLEVQIAGARIAPRALLASVPYALKAGDASTLGGLPASAYALAGSGNPPSTAGIQPQGGGTNVVANVTTTGGAAGYLPVFNGAATVVDSFLYQSSTGIGIGDTPNSAYKLDVNGASILRGAAKLPSIGSATTSAGTNSYALSLNASAYNTRSRLAVSPAYYLQAEPVGNNTASPSATLNLLYNGNNSTGAETGFYFNPNGTIHFATGQTFVANASGVAVDGNSTSGFGVEGTSSSGSGVEGTSSSSSGVEGSSVTGNGVYAYSSFGSGLLGVTAGVSPHTAGVIGVAGTGNTSGFSGIAGAWGDSSTHIGILGTSTQTLGVQGMSGTTYGVQGSTSGTNNSGFGAISPSAGVYGIATSNAPAVVGTSSQGDGGDFFGGGTGNGITAFGGGQVSTSAQGVGGSFTGGLTTSDTSAGAAGVLARGGDDDSPDGNVSGGGIIASGGYSYNGGNGGDGGHFTGGSSDYAYGGYGIYAVGGTSSDDGVGIAAYFDGNVSVNGTLNADLKNFQIDHPTDPSNKFLNHASIESSEMVNLYSGNVVTDAEGLATVQLPDWFQALNGDIRYQLTTIGKKSQVWIAAEVERNMFQIASDAPNVKVSWQITGVRHDAYAKAHPLVVEQEKGVHQRGLYKHPELYGQPVQKGIEWARHPATTSAKQKRSRLPK